MGPKTNPKPVRKPRDRRSWYQAAFALGINGWIPSWFKGAIFQGGVKGVCVPALTCSSGPSAMGACPIGAMQTFVGGLRFNLSIAEKEPDGHDPKGDRKQDPGKPSSHRAAPPRRDLTAASRPAICSSLKPTWA